MFTRIQLDFLTIFYKEFIHTELADKAGSLLQQIVTDDKMYNMFAIPILCHLIQSSSIDFEIDVEYFKELIIAYRKKLHQYKKNIPQAIKDKTQDLQSAAIIMIVDDIRSDLCEKKLKGTPLKIDEYFFN